MELISDVLDLIQRSGIGLLYDALVAGIDSKNKYERNYAKAAKDELANSSHPGLRTGCEYICVTCVKQLPKRKKEKRAFKYDAEVDSMATTSFFDTEATTSAERGGGGKSGASSEELDSRKCPTFALVNGYFPGKTPPCIAILNNVELSMVNRINVIARLSLLQPPSKGGLGGHLAGSITSFSRMTDVVVIANMVPNSPDPSQHIIINRHSTEGLPQELKWSPHKVRVALDWCEENNFLYEGKVKIPNTAEFNVDDTNESEEKLNEPLSIPVDEVGGDEDEDGVVPGPEVLDEMIVEETATAEARTEWTNEELFLHLEEPSDHDTILELKQLVAPDDIMNEQKRHTTEERASIYTTKHFLQFAFVNLYPYGRGTGNVSGKKVAAVARSTRETCDDVESDADEEENDDSGGPLAGFSDGRVNLAPGWNKAYIKHVLELGKNFERTP